MIATQKQHSLQPSKQNGSKKSNKTHQRELFKQNSSRLYHSHSYWAPGFHHFTAILLQERSVDAAAAVHQDRGATNQTWRINQLLLQSCNNQQMKFYALLWICSYTGSICCRSVTRTPPQRCINPAEVVVLQITKALTRLVTYVLMHQCRRLPSPSPYTPPPHSIYCIWIKRCDKWMLSAGWWSIKVIQIKQYIYVIQFRCCSILWWWKWIVFCFFFLLFVSMIQVEMNGLSDDGFQPSNAWPFW